MKSPQNSLIQFILQDNANAYFHSNLSHSQLIENNPLPSNKINSFELMWLENHWCTHTGTHLLPLYAYSWYLLLFSDRMVQYCLQPINASDRFFLSFQFHLFPSLICYSLRMCGKIQERCQIQFELTHFTSHKRLQLQFQFQWRIFQLFYAQQQNRRLLQARQPNAVYKCVWRASLYCACWQCIWAQQRAC